MVQAEQADAVLVVGVFDGLPPIDRLNTDKNFLMDNLSTILPDYFKLDQIVGEVNLFPVSPVKPTSFSISFFYFFYIFS